MNARHTPDPPRITWPPAVRAVMESACARPREEIMRRELQDMAAHLAALRSRVEALEAHHRVE